jgi:subtilisin family serine protease
MQRRTVTKFVQGLLATGVAMIAGCQTPVSDDALDELQLGLSAHAPAAITTPTVVPDEYIVVFRDGSAKARAQAMVQDLRSNGAVIKESYTVIPGIAGRFNAAHLATLRGNPDVAYIEPNQQVSVSTVFSNAPYGLDRIDSRTGIDGSYNDFGFNGSGIHIFVIDTGIRFSHHEFTGRLGLGFSALDGSPGIQDCNGHGTHVASIAAGTKFGVAKGAIVHAVRALDCAGSGTTADVIEGLNFVLTAAATVPAVANLSVFGPRSTALNDAIENLVTANIPVVAAAGNFNLDACLASPSSAPNALTVGATAQGETRAAFSDFGLCLDLFAPGVGVLGAGIANDDATASMDGTSQSAAHVTGAVALFLQRFPRTAALKVNGGVAGNATPGIVGDAHGSPNLFLFNDFLQPSGDSCFGRCGGQSPDFTCACDDLCVQFNDCCEDKDLFCSK